jgi:hypothetical protein
VWWIGPHRRTRYRRGRNRRGKEVQYFAFRNHGIRRKFPVAAKLDSSRGRKGKACFVVRYSSAHFTLVAERQIGWIVLESFPI